MKQFNIFGTQNNTSENVIKNAINKELLRRYGFNKLFKHTEEEPETTTLPLFIFKHFENPAPKANPYKVFKALFGGERIANPLTYAKQLVIDSNPKEKTFDEAMEQLQIIADRIREKKVDEYDFKIDGIPVKIYQKFIQIGYSIIPFDNYTNYFDSITSEKRKETIHNIVLNITNNITTYIAA